MHASTHATTTSLTTTTTSAPSKSGGISVSCSNGKGPTTEPALLVEGSRENGAKPSSSPSHPTKDTPLLPIPSPTISTLSTSSSGGGGGGTGRRGKYHNTNYGSYPSYSTGHTGYYHQSQYPQQTLPQSPYYYTLGDTPVYPVNYPLEVMGPMAELPAPPQPTFAEALYLLHQLLHPYFNLLREQSPKEKPQPPSPSPPPPSQDPSPPSSSPIPEGTKLPDTYPPTREEMQQLLHVECTELIDCVTSVKAQLQVLSRRLSAMENYMERSPSYAPRNQEIEKTLSPSPPPLAVVESSKRKPRKRAGRRKSGVPPENVSRLRDYWRSGNNDIGMDKPVFTLVELIRTDKMIQGRCPEDQRPLELKRHKVSFMLGGREVVVTNEEGHWFEHGRRAKNDVAGRAVQIVQKYVSELCNTNTSNNNNHGSTKRPSQQQQ